MDRVAVFFDYQNVAGWAQRSRWPHLAQSHS